MAKQQPIIIIGGGPAGLMAADTITSAGYPVHLYEGKPSLGRKFLMAGRGGLNLTHAEPYPTFLTRYTAAQHHLQPFLDAFTPTDLRAWVHNLGLDTFVGSSDRIFPTTMKASPLLRAWLTRLEQQGTTFHLNHYWQGWNDHGHPHFTTPNGPLTLDPPPIATLLALGGGSWRRLGSDAAWIPYLATHNIPITPLQPSNCGFETIWSDHFRQKFAGTPLKTITLTFTAADGTQFHQRGECVITEHGLEGSLIYAASALIRDTILATNNPATIYLDLTPDLDLDTLSQQLAQPRRRRSFSNHLRRQANITGVKTGLIYEFVPQNVRDNPSQLATAIKHLPLPIHNTRPIDEAISTAGGVPFAALNHQLMLHQLPGIFCAGEMLDWEAPTGGYLLTACFATGRAAGHGLLHYLAQQTTKPPPHTHSQ
ncbi:MAG TPA: TIGR03862 family flavoprotein [Anaerolineae bacterium]|nr:TIGR03862 family flavoprotein [Anaerolineae bacterium]